MRYPLRWFGLMLCGLFTANVRGAESWQPLFNGRDLDGWTAWVGKPHASDAVAGLPKDEKGNYSQALGKDSLGIFTVVKDPNGDAIIRVSGRIFSELRSNQSLQNYRLRLQFKWGEKRWPPRDKPGVARDSGILYHVHSAPGAEGRTWPRSLELQIQEHDVGDLYAPGAQVSVRSTLRAGVTPAIFDYDPQGEWHVFSQIPGAVGRCVKQPDNEKPNGEWNTVELICLGDDSVHVVNGKVVMRLHAAKRIDGAQPEPLSAGPIVLQCEGAELFYRRVEWQPITAIPAEFAEQKPGAK